MSYSVIRMIFCYLNSKFFQKVKCTVRTLEQIRIWWKSIFIALSYATNFEILLIGQGTQVKFTLTAIEGAEKIQQSQCTMKYGSRPPGQGACLKGMPQNMIFLK